MNERERGQGISESGFRLQATKNFERGRELNVANELNFCDVDPQAGPRRQHLLLLLLLI
jgi:hypothetical protein